MNQTLFFYKCQKLRLSLISEFFDYSQEYRIPFKVISSGTVIPQTTYICNDDFNKNIKLQNTLILDYVLLDGFCGNTSFSKSSGTIFLPNIPAHPQFEQNCTYSIAGGINTTISISVVQPQFQYSYSRYYQRCTDRVTVGQFVNKLNATACQTRNM